MFAPDQDKAASELLRVCKHGGKIGLANWTPESFIGQLFKTIGRYVPPAAGLKSPALWGTREQLDKFFGEAGSIEIAEQVFTLRYRSPRHWIDTWRSIYGPLQKAFDTLAPEIQAALSADLMTLIASLNKADDGTMVVPSAYFEVVVTKR
jgi:hypothetical protein